MSQFKLNDSPCCKPVLNESKIIGALIMATNPLVTVLLSAIILKDAIRMNQYIGMCLSLVVVVMVITQGKWVMLRHFQIALGDWIIMGANVCFALYGVLCRRYLKESKPLITTAMITFVGAVALLLNQLKLGGTPLLHLQRTLHKML